MNIIRSRLTTLTSRRLLFTAPAHLHISGNRVDITVEIYTRPLEVAMVTGSYPIRLISKGTFDAVVHTTWSKEIPIQKTFWGDL